MKTNFFILTAPRSGSTVLTRTLDQHPQIFCAGEIFLPSEAIYHDEWHFKFWGKKEKKGFSRKIFAVTNYINGYFFAASHLKNFYASKSENKEVRGFKLMIGHIKDFPSSWKYLQHENLKVIVLIRKNTFKEALSSFRARKLGVFHTEKQTQLAKEKVHVDAEKFHKRVEQLEALNKSILAKSQNMNRIVLHYEDLQQWNETLEKVFNFLEVDQMQMQPVLNKVSSENWRDGVENYKEIEAVMQAKYAHFLD